MRENISVVRFSCGTRLGRALLRCVMRTHAGCIAVKFYRSRASKFSLSAHAAVCLGIALLYTAYAILTDRLSHLDNPLLHGFVAIGAVGVLSIGLYAEIFHYITDFLLMEYEPVRFNEMQRYLGKIADKTLSQNLKELERDGLIHREMYPEIPPKVEYTLTERGRSLVKVLDGLCDWGTEHRP